MRNSDFPSAALFEISDSESTISIYAHDLVLAIHLGMIDLDQSTLFQPSNLFGKGTAGWLPLCPLMTAVGEINAYYIFGSALETVLQFLFVMMAWKWSRVSIENKVDSKVIGGIGSDS